MVFICVRVEFALSVMGPSLLLAAATFATMRFTFPLFSASMSLNWPLATRTFARLALRFSLSFSSMTPLNCSRVSPRLLRRRAHVLKDLVVVRIGDDILQLVAVSCA